MPTGDGILWNVVEEHLDEAEFLLERLEASFGAATLTLDQVAKGVEARLLSHADALVVGGAPIVDDMLVPALAAKKLAPSRASAIVVVLLLAGRFDLATHAMRHPAAPIARAALRACSLAGSAAMDAQIARALETPASPADRAPLLELAAERGLGVPSAPASLRSPDPNELKAALRLLQGATAPSPHEARILELLDHPDPTVRDAALVTALHHGSPHGWMLCQRLAADPDQPHPLAMTLVAGLGDPGHHRRLAQRLDSDAHRPSALRALGYAGNVELIPTLIVHASSKDERAAKLASEAIAMIAGLEVWALVPPKKPRRPPSANPLVLGADEEAKRGLPPFADAVPDAEAALPTLDADALAEWWTAAARRLDPRRRYVGGAPAGHVAFGNVLRTFPMRTRYLCALILSIRTGRGARVATRAFTRVQRAQIEEVTAKGAEPWSRSFGQF